MRLVLVDTNLLLLLVVGSADRSFIRAHKRLVDFDERSFELLAMIVESYDGTVTTPHVLTETSNLARYIANPARDAIQRKLNSFVETSAELAVPSMDGCADDLYLSLGLTDAIILRACARQRPQDDVVELLTTDRRLFNYAISRGLPAFDFQ